MYKKTVLENGVRIISEKLEHLKSVSLGIWVDTGSRDEETRENGISHFIEHMLFKGTAGRTSLEIAKELDAIGGLSNAFTGKENTCFHARVLGSHFLRLSDILSDIFLNSVFDPADIERERQVILQEINMVEDTPDDNIHVLFNRLFWIDHAIGMSVLGTGETVSAIGKENIAEHIRDFYVPERILVAAAGNVDHEDMVSCFEPVFGPLNGARRDYERTSPRSNAGLSVHYKDLEQVHLCLGGEGPSHTDERRFACAVLNILLGGNMSSRLFQEIRERRGLAYNVYSFVSSYADTGMMGIYVATDRQNVNPVLETIGTQILAVKNGDLSESDLAEAKEHLIGGIHLASESADSRMMRMARNEFVFHRYVGYEELVSSLKKVTLDQVVEAASDVFRDSRISLAALGPLREEDLDSGALWFKG